MENRAWKLVRAEQHPAFPEMSFPLEIHTDTLEFRIRIQGQTFTDRDATEVLKQARAYLLKQFVPGEWQPMIELARYSRQMRAKRYSILVEENGAILRHPWVEAPEEIVLARISELPFHTREYDVSRKLVPPCVHDDGLSTYYHLPYIPEVWERVQALVRTFNGFFARHSAFLKTVSSPHPTREMHFLEQWEQLSFFEVESKEAGEESI